VDIKKIMVKGWHFVGLLPFSTKCYLLSKISFLASIDKLLSTDVKLIPRILGLQKFQNVAYLKNYAWT